MGNMPYLPSVLLYPLRELWVSADYDDHGYKALDLGWWDYDSSMPEDSGRNPRLYAMADGVVTSIINSHPDDPDWEGYGNYIIIRYDIGYVSLFAHIKRDSFMVRVGDRVRQGQPVARMGNSGYSYGNHLHLEVCKGTEFVRHGGIDFIPVVYATDWHIVDPSTQRDYNFRHKVIVPVSEDVTKTQVYVYGEDLRVRTAPNLSGSVVGFADKGFYNVELVSEDTDYIWCNVQDDYWLATPTDVSEMREAVFKPVEESTALDQICVEIDDLRIRRNPSTSADVVGWCPVGFYNVCDTYTDDDYVWIKTCGYWVACVDGVRYIPKEDDKDEQIRKLTAEVERLTAEVDELRGQVNMLVAKNDVLTTGLTDIDNICHNLL